MTSLMLGAHCSRYATLPLEMGNFHLWQILKQHRAEIAFAKAGLHKDD